MVARSVGGEVPSVSKLPPKAGLRRGKGLMTGDVPIKEIPPVLLREDYQYAFKQLCSIIKGEDYKDLGHQAIEAIRETSIFNLAQVHINRFYFHLSSCFIVLLTLMFVFS